MRTIGGTLAIALAAMAATGCGSSPLKERFESAGKQISSARAAGAPTYAPIDYTGAREALDLARDAESDALSRHKDAEGKRDDAKQELVDLGKRQGATEEALQDSEKRRVGAEATLVALKRRAVELRAKGVSDQEVDRALGDQIALTEVEASAARAEQKTLRAELELIGCRKQQCTARIAAANEGITAADQQLIHASALCDTAETQAQVAEAHAIARRKAELTVR